MSGERFRTLSSPGLPFFQFGIFHHGSKSYLIQPPDKMHKAHSVSQVDEDEPTAADFILPNDDYSFFSTQGMCFKLWVLWLPQYPYLVYRPLLQDCMFVLARLRFNCSLVP